MPPLKIIASPVTTLAIAFFNVVGVLIVLPLAFKSPVGDT